MADKKAIKPNPLELFDSLPGKPVYYYFGVYLIAVIAMFHSTLFDPSKLLFGTDLMEAGVFFRGLLTGYFNQHFSWPVWDPFIHGGMPFVDGMHGDIFYIPSFLLYILFDFTFAWGLILTLHIFLAGIFMYMFLKEINIRGMIAFIGGLMYMMAPFLVSLVYAGHNGKIFVITQLPLTFFIYHRAYTRGKLIYYVLLAFMIFFGITSAHMQMAYYLFLSLGAYFIVTTVQRWRKDGVNPIKPVMLFSASVIIGLLMAAVQYVTPYQYLQEDSMRTLRTEGENRYEYATSWSMNWEELAADFFPEFCGDNIQGQRTTYWGKNYFKLNSEHFGIIPLFLAVFGIGLWQRRGKWFFFWLSIIATLYALGANTPFFRLFYLLPGVKSFRAPGMINYLVGFAIIALGCMGLESFFSLKSKDKRIIKVWKTFTYITIGYSVFALMIILLQMDFFELWLGIFGTADSQKEQVLRMSTDVVTLGAIISLVAVWGLWLLLKFNRDRKLKPQYTVIAIALFTFFYMWYFNSRYIIPVDPKPTYAKQQIVDWLAERNETEQFRTLCLPKSMKDYYLGYHGLEELSFTILHGNQLASFEKLAGNRNGSNGLIFQSVQDLLNARYVISTQKLPPQYFAPERFEQVARVSGKLVYENKTALPRAFPVYRYTIVPKEDQAIIMLSGTNFDYRSTLIFDKQPENAPPEYPDSMDFGVIPAKVYDKDNNRFKVDVEMLEDGFLFLSENYYHAWKAYENGKQLTTLKADVTFRAIPLSKGNHTIECRYESAAYDTAMMVSKTTFIIMLLALIGLFIQSKLRRKNESES